MKFSIKDFFNKCDQIRFDTKSINTIHQDSNLLSYLGPKLWEMVWRDFKNLEAVKAWLLIRTNPTDSANGMFINLAFYDFLINILCLY